MKNIRINAIGYYLTSSDNRCISEAILHPNTFDNIYLNNGNNDPDIGFPNVADLEALEDIFNPGDSNIEDLSAVSTTSSGYSELFQNQPHQSGTSPETSSVNSCSICGDGITGKHYGAPSCDGCKGFFRRSVRKNQSYTCKFIRTCTVDKDKRNQCRYCRLQKCFKSGMKKEAVQNERDRVLLNSSKSSNYEDYHSSGGLSARILLHAEKLSKPTSNSNILGDGLVTLSTPVAEIRDICESMKQELLYLIQWAKNIPVFNKLSIEDQIALLRAHGGEHLLLGLAYRSVPFQDVLLLGNNRAIQRFNESTREDFSSIDDLFILQGIGHISNRILDMLVKSLRDIHISETEYACLKALVLFDPNAVGLTNSNLIEALRCQVLNNLENDIHSDRKYDWRGRFGKLLLVLSPLQSISRQMIQQVQFAIILGVAEIDNLLEEMLFGRSR